MKQRRLQKLKMQAAAKGINTDPEIAIEIEDLEQEIANLQAQRHNVSDTINTKATGAPMRALGTIGIVGWATIIAAIATVIGVGIALWPTTADDDIHYLVEVSDDATSEVIPNAAVRISVPGRAPINGFTDSTGAARLIIASEYAGREGRLRVEADGYEIFQLETQIEADQLPEAIRLSPLD